MASRPPARVLAGVALVAGCTLALQIVLTRVFSAALFYHFTFLAISLALIGTGGAAMLVYVRPRWFAEPRATGSLALWCVVLAASLVVVPAALVHLDYTVTSSITLRFAGTLAAASVLSAIPFFAAGMAITLAITRYTRWIHRVYAVDLVGAGAGALLIVPLMWEVAAPTLLVGIGLVAAIAAALVAGSARWRSAGVALVALAGIGIVLASETSLYHLDPPIDDEVVSDRWTPLSRVVGYRSSATQDLANVTYDRDYAPVPRYRPGDPLPDWRTLSTGPQSIGYALAPRGHVLVIGGGGGRDIYNALSSGQERVDVIELNRAIVETVDDELGPEYGSAYSLPRVNVQTGDGRSELAESDARYDAINIGFTNTLSGNAAQGYALTENNLYTTEAIDVYLDHLGPRGVLSISRLYRLVGDEALRATILSLEALEERGIRNPERHVVVLLGRDILGARLGTVLTRLEPWTPEELTRIRRLATERGEGVAFAPGGPYQLEWAQLAKAESRDDFCANYRVDVCAPTDDKPFFLNFERLSDVGAETPPGYFFSVKPFTVLLIALGVLAAICALAFAAPLALVGREGRPSLSSLGFFAAIGLGFLLLEVAMIQRFVLFLGFPTYSLSVVLASLLVSTGVGAWLSGRFRDPRRALTIAMVATTALIVASAFGLAPLLRSLIDLPFGARILVAAAIIAPFGLLLGTAMPTGLARLSALYPRGAAWAWGINGVASVLASVVAITVAITWGFTVATLVAAACYAGAAAHAAFGRWPAAPDAAAEEPELGSARPALSSRG